MKSLLYKLPAYLVHLFTASGAVVGLLAINAIYHQQFMTTFWLMGIAILIDAIDGTFARWFKVKKALPRFDGALLDNIVDYLNYVVVPAFFIINSSLLASHWRMIGAIVMLLASAYQFCQIDAKTKDHFFKGFPSYWNIAVIYLFLWQTSPPINLVIIVSLAILVFVPIKYVYPSRLDYLSNKKYLRRGMLMATFLWGMATFGLLWIYPNSSALLGAMSSGYLILYSVVSVYRTFVSLPNHYKNKNSCAIN